MSFFTRFTHEKRPQNNFSLSVENNSMVSFLKGNPVTSLTGVYGSPNPLTSPGSGTIQNFSVENNSMVLFLKGNPVTSLTGVNGSPNPLTIPGSGTTVFPLPGSFPWAAGARGKCKTFFA